MSSLGAPADQLAAAVELRLKFLQGFAREADLKHLFDATPLPVVYTQLLMSTGTEFCLLELTKPAAFPASPLRAVKCQKFQLACRSLKGFSTWSGVQVLEVSTVG